MEHFLSRDGDFTSITGIGFHIAGVGFASEQTVLLVTGEFHLHFLHIRLGTSQFFYFLGARPNPGEDCLAILIFIFYAQLELNYD